MHRHFVLVAALCLACAVARAVPADQRASATAVASVAAEPVRDKAPSSDALVGLIGTLVGAAIGAVISIVAVRLAARTQREQERAARIARTQTARALVTAEIDHNLHALEGYLAQTDLENPLRTYSNLSGREWIAVHPTPNWSTIAWERALGDLLSGASPAEMLHVFSLYNDLKAYSLATELAVRYHTMQLEGKVDDALVAATYGVQGGLARKIRQAGNPLRPEAVA
ncbi:hypothetical protein [Rhodanobacter sp. B04]|uniref:hypothetical protein n=1 Tax=Rhodanobacter sp. B04 TaxID=1945860 RepID=UPI0011159F8D|nr:hypothetical protein [Rhodanobacter sp. B04]